MLWEEHAGCPPTWGRSVDCNSWAISQTDPRQGDPRGGWHKGFPVDNLTRANLKCVLYIEAELSVAGCIQEESGSFDGAP